MALGTLGSAVLDLLKVLNPSEIKRLTEFKVGAKGLSKKKLKIAGDGIEGNRTTQFATVNADPTALNSSQSNILPFKRENEGDGGDEETDPYKQKKVVPSRTPGEDLENPQEMGQQSGNMANAGALFDPFLGREEQPGPGVQVDSFSPQQEEKAFIPHAPKNDLEAAGVLSASTIRQIEIEKEEHKKKQKVSASVFLMQERKKLAKTLDKLKQVEVLKAYQEESEIDLEMERSTNSNDLTFSPGNGILVNRKQY